jgi:hypothetical protein
MEAGEGQKPLGLPLTSASSQHPGVTNGEDPASLSR